MTEGLAHLIQEWIAAVLEIKCTYLYLNIFNLLYKVFYENMAEVIGISDSTYHERDIILLKLSLIFLITINRIESYLKKINNIASKYFN